MTPLSESVAHRSVPGHGHHWFGNAESYLRIGKALGQAMIELIDEGGTADKV